MAGTLKNKQETKQWTQIFAALYRLYLLIINQNTLLICKIRRYKQWQ